MVEANKTDNCDAGTLGHQKKDYTIFWCGFAMPILLAGAAFGLDNENTNDAKEYARARLVTQLQENMDYHHGRFDFDTLKTTEDSILADIPGIKNHTINFQEAVKEIEKITNEAYKTPEKAHSPSTLACGALALSAACLGFGSIAHWFTTTRHAPGCSCERCKPKFS